MAKLERIVQVAAAAADLIEALHEFLRAFAQLSPPPDGSAETSVFERILMIQGRAVALTTLQTIDEPLRRVGTISGLDLAAEEAFLSEAAEFLSAIRNAYLGTGRTVVSTVGSSCFTTAEQLMLCSSRKSDLRRMQDSTLA